MCSKEKEVKFTAEDIQDLTGYVAIVTGGNAGIGYETTKQLAVRNCRVYIASRSQSKVDEATRKIAEERGKPVDIHFLQLDLQDLKSVRAAGLSFLQRESRLDILINNAGIMTVPYELTKDGFEKQWQVNYVAPFVLTTTLLPLMLTTAGSSGSKHRVRVVNVASNAAFGGPKTIQFDDVNMTDAKGLMELWQRYGQSKQGIIRFSQELNDRFSAQGVTAYSLHPGIVKSGLQGHDPTIMGSITRVGMHFIRMTPLEGALTSLYCATSPRAPEQAQGGYWEPVAKPNAKAKEWLEDKATNGRLWEWSEAQMTRL